MRSASNFPSLRVAADPDLLPIEKETSLWLVSGSSSFEVSSLHPSAIRGLLSQPEFAVTDLRTKSVRGRECIVGVEGRLPIGCFHVGRQRKDGRLSRVFGRRVRGHEYPALRSYYASQGKGTEGIS